MMKLNNINTIDARQSCAAETHRKQDSLRISLFMVCFYLMIVMTIINGNRFLAGLKFVIVPVFALMFVSLLQRRELSIIGLIADNIFILITIPFAVLSTLKSNVVDLSINSSCTGLIVVQVLYMCVTTVSLNKALVRKIIMFYVRFCTLLCCLLLYNYLIGSRIGTSARTSITYFGISKDANYLTAFITGSYAIILYMILYGKRSIMNILSFCVILLAIFLSGSRASFLAAILVSAIIISKMLIQKAGLLKKILLFTLMFITLAFMYYLFIRNPLSNRMLDADSYANNIRLIIWRYALIGYYNNPLLGSGVGAGSYYSQQYVRWVTHNCFLDLLTGQGIIGCALMLLLFISLIAVKKNNVIFMIALLIAFMFPLFFINGYESATFWVPMILIKIVSRVCKSSDDIAGVLVDAPRRLRKGIK